MRRGSPPRVETRALPRRAPFLSAFLGVSRASPPPERSLNPAPAPPIRADVPLRPGEASSAPVSPASRPRANAPPPSFDVSDNARLALENKQAQLDALRAKLGAAEDALKARDARQRDLERRLARHEGDQVMKEAANLNDMMTNAMRDVRGFFSRSGNAANERRRDGSPEARVDAAPRRTSALRPTSRSMLSRFTSGGDRSRDPSASETTPTSKTRVAFVDDSEQARLIKEGDYVAALAASRRACAELAETLGKREASLASTRRRAETTKASLTAAVAKLDDETARRKRAESELESVRFFVRDGDGDGAQHLRRSLTRARDIVRDALGAAASAASAGVPIRAFRSERRPDVNDDFLRFDAGAATAAAALPALAALAHARSLASGHERPGRVARDMLALGAANAATEAMAAYPRDATVATRACELLAALARGAAADATLDPSASLDLSAASSIVDALREHRSDGDACAWAAEATAAFAEAGGANAALACVAAGAAEALADAARWHPSDEDVVGAVARAVVRLAAADASVEDALERSGAAEIARETSRETVSSREGGNLDGDNKGGNLDGDAGEGHLDGDTGEGTLDGDTGEGHLGGDTSWLDDLAANGGDVDGVL